MKAVFEAIIGVFCMMLVVVSCMVCIVAGLDYKNAVSMKSIYIGQIEESNFTSSVLTNIIKDSISKKYNDVSDADGNSHSPFMILYHKQTETGTNNVTPVYVVRDGSPTPPDSVGVVIDSSGNIISSNFPSDTSDVYMVQLNLVFNYSFEPFNVNSKNRTLVGYAR